MSRECRSPRNRAPTNGPSRNAWRRSRPIAAAASSGGRRRATRTPMQHRRRQPEKLPANSPHPAALRMKNRPDACCRNRSCSWPIATTGSIAVWRGDCFRSPSASWASNICGGSTARSTSSGQCRWPARGSTARSPSHTLWTKPCRPRPPTTCCPIFCPKRFARGNLSFSSQNRIRCRSGMPCRGLPSGRSHGACRNGRSAWPRWRPIRRSRRSSSSRPGSAAEPSCSREAGRPPTRCSRVWSRFWYGGTAAAPPPAAR